MTRAHTHIDAHLCIHIHSYAYNTTQDYCSFRRFPNGAGSDGIFNRGRSNLLRFRVGLRRWMRILFHDGYQRQADLRHQFVERKDPQTTLHFRHQRPGFRHLQLGQWWGGWIYDEVITVFIILCMDFAFLGKIILFGIIYRRSKKRVGNCWIRMRIDSGTTWRKSTPLTSRTPNMGEPPNAFHAPELLKVRNNVAPLTSGFKWHCGVLTLKK